MDDTMERLARAALDRAAPGVLDEIETEVGAIHSAAVGRWPKGKNPRTRKQPFHSRDRLEMETRISEGGETVSGHVTNDAWWARYVTLWFAQGRNAFTELLRKPMRKAQKRIADSILQRIIDDMRRGS